MLEAGGNSRLFNFLAHYDQNYEPVFSKYYTKAAEYYRVKLKEIGHSVMSKDNKMDVN